MLGRELPFPAALVPAADGDGFEASEVLFGRDRIDRARPARARSTRATVTVASDHRSRPARRTSS